MSDKPLRALNDVLDVIKSIEDFGTGGQGSINSETEHLIPKQKDTVISLSDSDSSDSEFGDIIHQRRRTSPQSSHHSHHERRVTNSGTIVHLLKANVGTGLLAMPKAMAHFGLLAGLLGILILGSMYIYCIHLLLDVNRAVVKRVMIDRKIHEIKITIIRLLKAGKRAERRRKIKQVAEDCASATEETSAKSKNWKTQFAADFEVGESSSSKKEDPKKKYTKMKPGSHDRYQPTTGGKKKCKNGGKPSTSKLEDSDENSTQLEEMEQNIEQGKPSASKQEDPNENAARLKQKVKNTKLKTPQQEDPDKITELDASVKKGDEEEQPSESNQDNSKSDTQKQDNELGSKQDRQNEEDAEIKLAEAVILRTLDYPKLVELSFHYGLPANKYAGKFFKFYVQLLMLLTHIGCCCVCFLFVAETLAEISTEGKFIFHSNSFQMVAYAVPIMICLSFIPDGHELTGVTTVAFLLQLCGVLTMLYFFFQGKHRDDIHLYIAPAETWHLYFGILFYAFEGTGVTLHLESHMEKKQDFRGWNGILNKSMYFIIPLYMVFGALGYWKFGDDVKTSVTFNLPEERMTDLMQFMTALGILLTYPFHLSFVLTPIKELFIQDDFSQGTKNFLDLIIRSLFVIFTFVMSALIPYLELQLTVLGAVASCFLILVVPPFMSLNSYYFLPDLHDYSRWRILFHVFIMLVGIAGTGLGSYTTIKNLPLYYPNSTIFG